MRSIDQAGINLIKQFEGCKLDSYQDQGGKWTIGYGHTDPTVCAGMKITESQAELILMQDLERFESIDEYITATVNDNQYSAMICLAYNIGKNAFKFSRALQDVNNGVDPTMNWMKWNHVNGVVNAGLTKRRQAELELFHA